MNDAGSAQLGVPILEIAMTMLRVLVPMVVAGLFTAAVFVLGSVWWLCAGMRTGPAAPNASAVR